MFLLDSFSTITAPAKCLIIDPLDILSRVDELETSTASSSRDQDGRNTEYVNGDFHVGLTNAIYIAFLITNIARA